MMMKKTFDITPDNLNKFKLEQAFMLSLYTSFHKRVRELEEHALNLVNTTCTELGLEANYINMLCGISPGCMSSNWDPHFMLCSIRPLNYNDLHFIPYKGKWFATTNPEFENIYTNQIDFGRKLTHVNLDKLTPLCNVLTEKTGMRVEYKNITLYNSNNHFPIESTIGGLLGNHKGSMLLCQGHKLIDGTENPWAILQTKKHTIVFYYSTASLGIGYDKYVDSNHKNEFFSWLGDKTELASLVSEKQYKRIVE